MTTANLVWTHAEGDTCPMCKIGKLNLKTIERPGVNYGKRFLLCSEFRQGDMSTCQFFYFPKGRGA